MRGLASLILVAMALAPLSVQAKVRSEGDRLLEAASKAKDSQTRLSLLAKALATGTLSKADAASAHNNRAALLADLGRREEAVAEVTKAIGLVPGAGFYYGNRARIRMSLKRYALAAADFTKVIELSAKPSAYDYYDRCQARAKAKAKAAAIADCRRALELNGNHRRARLLLDRLTE